MGSTAIISPWNPFVGVGFMARIPDDWRVGLREFSRIRRLSGAERDASVALIRPILDRLRTVESIDDLVVEWHSRKILDNSVNDVPTRVAFAALWIEINSKSHLSHFEESYIDITGSLRSILSSQNLRDLNNPNILLLALCHHFSQHQFDLQRFPAVHALVRHVISNISADQSENTVSLSNQYSDSVLARAMAVTRSRHLNSLSPAILLSVIVREYISANILPESIHSYRAHLLEELDGLIEDGH